MNIFLLSKNTNENVKFYCDRHVVKMIVEAAQIICSAYHSVGVPAPYKATHKHHPCVRWASESFENILFLHDLLFALNSEWKHRFNHTHNHLSFEKVWHWVNSNSPQEYFPNSQQTKFPLAMPDEYKSECPVKSYRNYYIGSKRHLAKWTKRTVPYWWR